MVNCPFLTFERKDLKLDTKNHYHIQEKTNKQKEWDKGRNMRAIYFQWKFPLIESCVINDYWHEQNSHIVKDATLNLGLDIK